MLNSCDPGKIGYPIAHQPRTSLFCPKVVKRLPHANRTIKSSQPVFWYMWITGEPSGARQFTQMNSFHSLHVQQLHYSSLCTEPHLRATYTLDEYGKHCPLSLIPPTHITRRFPTHGHHDNNAREDVAKGPAFVTDYFYSLGERGPTDSQLSNENVHNREIRFELLGWALDTQEMLSCLAPNMIG